MNREAVYEVVERQPAKWTTTRGNLAGLAEKGDIRVFRGGRVRGLCCGVDFSIRERAVLTGAHDFLRTVAAACKFWA